MATERKEVLNIDTGNAQNSINELGKQLDQVNENLETVQDILEKTFDSIESFMSRTKITRMINNLTNMVKSFSNGLYDKIKEFTIKYIPLAEKVFTSMENGAKKAKDNISNWWSLLSDKLSTSFPELSKAMSKALLMPTADVKNWLKLIQDLGLGIQRTQDLFKKGFTFGRTSNVTTSIRMIIGDLEKMTKQAEKEAEKLKKNIDEASSKSSSPSSEGGTGKSVDNKELKEQLEQLKALEKIITGNRAKIKDLQTILSKGFNTDGTLKLADSFALAKNNLVGLTKQLPNLGALMAKLATSPLGITILAIVTAIAALKAALDQLKEAFNRNDEAIAKAGSIMAPFKAILESIYRAFDDIIQAFVDITTSAGSFGDVLSFLIKVALKPLELLIVAVRLNILALKTAFDLIAKALGAVTDGVKWALNAFSSFTGVSKVLETVKGWIDNIKNAINELFDKMEQNPVGKYIVDYLRSVKEIVTTQEELTQLNKTIAEQELRLKVLRQENAEAMAEEVTEMAKLELAQNRMRKGSAEWFEIEKKRNALEIESKTRELGLAKTELTIMDAQNSKLHATHEQLQKRAELLAQINTLEADILALQDRRFDEEEKIEAKRYSNEIRHNNYLIQLAKNEVELADIEQKLADGYKNSIEIRIEAVNKEAAIRKENLKIQIAEAELQLALIKMINSDSDKSNDNLEEQAQLTATLINLRSQYSDIEIEAYNKTNKLIKEAIELKKEEAGIYTNYMSSVLDYQLALLQYETSQLTQGTDEWLASRKEELAIERDLVIEAQNLRLLETQLYYEEEIRLAQENMELKEQLEREYAATVATIRLESQTQLMQIDQKDIESTKTATEFRVDSAVSMASAITSVLGSIASAYKSEINAELEAGNISEAEAEKRFEQVKGMQIAVATMNMLAGITSAVSGLFTTKSGPWDIALAAVQAAAIAASGAANIAQIKEQKFNKTGSSGSVAQPNVQMSIVPPVQYSSQVQGASQERETNDYRVVVLESDISNTQKRVEVAQSESRF